MPRVLQHPPRQYRAGAGAGAAGGAGAAVSGPRVGRAVCAARGPSCAGRGITVVCVASGNSLTAQDCDAVARWKAQAPTQGRRIVGVVNESWRHLPGADILYGADGKWWRHSTASGDRCIDDVRRNFSGALWTCDVGASREFGLERVEARHLPGLCTECGRVHTGAGNGGMQLVNLVWHLYRPGRIVLLGYDMQVTAGRMHFHGNHRAGLGDPNPDLLRRWAEAAAPMARDLQALGVQVLNCSRSSAARGWPRMNLEAALALHVSDPVAA